MAEDDTPDIQTTHTLTVRPSQLVFVYHQMLNMLKGVDKVHAEGNFGAGILVGM